MSRMQTLPILGCLLVTAGYGLFASLFACHGPEESQDHDAEAIQACAAYLPPEVTLATRFTRDGPGEDPTTRARLVKLGALSREYTWTPAEIITVRVRLIELGASCRDGMIYAADGRPVYFYTPVAYRAPQETCGHGLALGYSLRRQDAAEMAALLNNGHVVVLHPTSSNIRRDPEYLKRSAAQLKRPTQSTPDTAAPPP